MPTIALLALTLLLPPSTSQTPADTGETVTIDGARHPEQIPQWSAWAVSLRFIAASDETMGEEGIPTTVYRALSKSERAVLVKDVLAAVKEQNECAGRVLTLSAGNPGATPGAMPDKVKDIQMDCRRATLKARDHLLARLPPAGQAALRALVESQKQGQTITVLKSDLARFRLPE
jgi:hypothetical protein